MRPVEVWANGRKWRYITVYPIKDRFDIQYSWGAFDNEFDHYMKMFGGSLRFTMDAAWGSGSEKWYKGLEINAAKNQVAKLRKSAEKAGFKKIGTI